MRPGGGAKGRHNHALTETEFCSGASVELPAVRPLARLGAFDRGWRARPLPQSLPRRAEPKALVVKEVCGPNSLAQAVCFGR